MRKYIQYILFIAATIAVNTRAKAQVAAVKYKLPQYKKFQLSNGLTVYLMEKHTVPVISISAIIPAGAVFDSSNAGIASLTATCLKCGTKNYTKQQIDEAFDFAGASLESYAGKEFAMINAKMAVKDEDKLLPVLKDVLVNPVFPDSEFTKEKKRDIANLAQAKESPARVINLYWSKFFYANNAYGNITTGIESTVKTFTANDLHNFYAMYYHPQGSAIAIVGDFNADDMKKKMEDLFGNWKKTSAEITMPPPSNNNINTTRILLVNKDDARETTILVGVKGMARNNADYISAQVVNTFFGGRFTSWLNDELRVKSGLTYGAGSYFDAKKTDGAFLISTHTANETTAPTLQKIMEVVNRLQTETINDTILTSAKNYMIGELPPRFQSSEQLSGLLTNMFWYGYDESYINNFETSVNALTVDKTEDVIKKYFPKNNLQIVLIGKSSNIKSIAEKYGTVTEVQLKDDIGKGF